MKTRGLGFVYQPQYRATSTGEVKTSQVWWISYSVRGDRQRESSESTNRADAVRLLKLRTGQAAMGKPVGATVERTTLDDLIAMVEADYIANGVAFQAYRREQGAKPSTVNYEVAVLRRGFRLGRNKVPARPDFVMQEVDNVRKGFFEPEQYRAVVEHLPAYLKPVAQVAYITGWRTKSELLTRQWKHVDFEAGWLRLEPGEGKTRKGRDFPFTPELRAVLEAQRERVLQLQRATGRIIPWVFVHTAGEGGRTATGSSIKNFRGAWAKACSAAGVPGRLVHDFRRSAVRNLERAGVPRSAAMALTGHKTEAVYRRYAIVDSAMLQEAAARLGKFHAAEADSQSSVKVIPISANQ